MRVLILSTLDPIAQTDSACYANTNNHFVFYSLEISHELQRLGIDVRIASIFNATDGSIEVEQIVCEDESIVLALGYYDNLLSLCEIFEGSAYLRGKALFTMSTAVVLHSKIHTHFVMKQQTFFNRIQRQNLVVFELPIPKTLKLRDAEISHRYTVCIDGPAKSAHLQYLSPNMAPIYDSLLGQEPPQSVCQLSPCRDYYTNMGLDQYQPPSGIDEVPYLSIPKLENFLSQIDHFIITVCESYGAIVADCLSTNTVVHYPIEPLVPRASLQIVGSIPNCIPFSTVSELCTNIHKYKFRASDPSCPNPYVFELVAEYISNSKVGDT